MAWTITIWHNQGVLGERDICYTQELQNTSMHIPDDQYTEEYTVIGAEASKEISQTNQKPENQDVTQKNTTFHI